MDIANPTTFKLLFPKVPTTNEAEDSDEFFLNLFQTVLPSVELEANEQHWQGNRLYGSAVGINYGSFTPSFFVDEDFKNYIMIFDWMMAIRNGIGTQYHGKNATDYQIDSRLVVMDNFNNPIISFKFTNLWPSSLGEITFSYQEGESFLTCDAEFLYDYFEKE